jgi:hypothetical protein
LGETNISTTIKRYSFGRQIKKIIKMKLQIKITIFFKKITNVFIVKYQDIK